MNLELLTAALFAVAVLTGPELECHFVSDPGRCDLNHIGVADVAVVSYFLLALLVNDRLLPLQTDQLIFRLYLHDPV